MRVMGIDLALHDTGIAVVDDGNKPVVLHTETIHLPARSGKRADWNLRNYATFADRIRTLVLEWQVTNVAYEHPTRPFRGNWGDGKGTPGMEFNASQGLGLAEGFLCAQLVALRKTIPILTVRAVKIADAKAHASLKGNENASKADVRMGLHVRYGFRFKDQTGDEVDAISIAMVVADPEGRGPLL